METYRYTKITPGEVFLPYFERDFTEAELWTGARRNEFGNRPSGCRFLDVFAGIIRRRGYVDVGDICREMNVTAMEMTCTIGVLTDRPPKAWIDWWALTSICEMLEKTDWPMKKIAQKLNFSSPSAMSRYFAKHKKMAPGEWRIGKK